MITPELPRTPFTSKIAGGAQTYWGMSMNKMQVGGAAAGAAASLR